MERDRLSLDRCRRLLGPASDQLTDDEVLQARDRLYSIAGVTVDAFNDVKQSAHDSFDVEQLNSGPDAEVILSRLGLDMSEPEKYEPDDLDYHYLNGHLQ